MGKGRDKRRKKEDPEKAAKRTARQAQKILRHEHKNDANNESEDKSCASKDTSTSNVVFASGFNNEESIETTLHRLQRLERRVKIVEEVPNVEPPSPRVNIVFSLHPSREHELLIFGGEYWNGAVTQTYNDTFFYHTKKNTWSRLSTAINPSPRSSSQGIVYKHYLIIFGGEFVSQSQSQYLHFRDVWRYDGNKSEWEEMKSCKNGPSSRSGHRMVLWRRNGVMFGGFYDNALECHYYNDLWLLKYLDAAPHWQSVNVAATGELPAPRSGHNMAVYQDTLFVFGGYSTEKFNRFKKSEATVHHDLWMISLANTTPETESSSAPLQPLWIRVKLGGIPPPIRAGVASCFRDKRLYLFGGVVDIESPGGVMVSTFCNDLFVFHIDSKKFYPVVIRPSSSRESGVSHNSSSNFYQESKLRSRHIANLAEELSLLQLEKDTMTKPNAHKNCDNNNDTFIGNNNNLTFRNDDMYDENSTDESDNESEISSVNEQTAELKQSYEVNKNGILLPHRRMDAAIVISNTNNNLYLFGGQFERGDKEITMSDLFALNLNRLDNYSVLLSHDLSTAEWLGAPSVNSANSWESGSTVVSAAFDFDEFDDDEEEEEEDDDAFDDNNNENENDNADVTEDKDDNNNTCKLVSRSLSHSTHTQNTPAMLGGANMRFSTMPRETWIDALHDNGEDAPIAIPAELPMSVTPAKDEMFADGVTHRTGKKGLKVHKEQLLAQLGATSLVPTPTKDEEYNTFYIRTKEFWEHTAREANDNKLNSRQLRKEAMAFARRRYNEAQHLLKQLKLVEERETIEREFFRERQREKERMWQEQSEDDASSK